MTEHARYEPPAGSIPTLEVPSLEGVTRVRSDGVRTVFRLPAVPQAERRPGASIPIVSASASSAAHDVRAALDGDLSTRWLVEPQQPDQWVELDLGEVRDVGLVELSLGGAHLDYPRRLVISVSQGRTDWRVVWEGSTVGEAVLAAIRSPLEVRMQFGFEPQPARYVQLRQTSDGGGTWSIAEARVHGGSD